MTGAGRFGATLAVVVGFATVAGCGRGVRPPPAPPRIAPGTPEFLVEGDATRARAAGASARTVVASGSGAPGDNLGARVEVPAGSCLLVLARGSSTIDDLDVFVYGDDGTSLGSDETPDPRASVIVCPPLPKRAYVFARVAAGHGLIAVSAQTVRAEDADRVAAVVAARGEAREGSVAPATWPGLEEGLAAHRKQVGGTWHDIRRVAVPLDPRAATRLSATIEPGQCLDLYAEAATEVAFTELSVLDPDGRILAQVPADLRSPAEVVCAPGHAEVTFALRPHGGRGLAAVVLSTSTDAKPSAGFLFLHDSNADRPLGEVQATEDAELRARGLPAPRTVVSGVARVAGRASVSLGLEPGCARVDVLGGAPLRGISVHAWSEGGALLDRSDGARTTAIFVCTEKKTAARLDVEALAHGGPFVVELRPLPNPSPFFQQAPLAAARVLRSLSVPGAPAASPTVEVVAPSPTALIRRELAVGKGECASLVFALGSGLEGPELRVIDSTSGDELALERRDDTTSTTVCGAGIDRAIRVEMRADAGAGAALFAVARRSASR
ncbi:MAG TPA: hypothetical protein VHE30_10175 [Polyangiaceae bacterium]|nr:hypothetical protein [Polyangiaceae bacterium]